MAEECHTHDLKGAIGPTIDELIQRHHEARGIAFVPDPESAHPIVSHLRCYACREFPVRPVELTCGHIVCSSHAGGTNCTCGAPIRSRAVPSRVVIAILSHVVGYCGVCKWKGKAGCYQAHVRDQHPGTALEAECIQRAQYAPTETWSTPGQCPQGHELLFSTTFGSAKMFSCAYCGLLTFGDHLRCPECPTRKCKRCAGSDELQHVKDTRHLRTAKCMEGHAMALMSQAPFWYDRPGCNKCCSLIETHPDMATAPFQHCNICSYDLCAQCSRR